VEPLRFAVALQLLGFAVALQLLVFLVKAVAPSAVPERVAGLSSVLGCQ
jgi:hypothetical protein